VRRLPVALGCATLAAVCVVLAAARVGERAGALSNWQALVLGITQGLTEFLPISSSGHLILVPWLGDWSYLETHEDFNKTFDVALHLGTLVAAVAYFRRDVLALVRAWLRSVAARSVRDDEERLAWVIAAATVPAALVGGVGEDFISRRLGDPWQIAVLLALFGLALLLADRRPQDRGVASLRWHEAVGVGFAQALALAPGVSRSGVTITAGRFLRLSRDAAARFSFLLLIPVVLGAVVLKGTKDVLLGSGLPPGSAGPFIVGTIAAAVSGLAAIWALLGYVRTHTYAPFVVYRFAAAAFILLVIAAGWRDASF
jgi:undecaprenyl-diphosphatase